MATQKPKIKHPPLRKKIDTSLCNRYIETVKASGLSQAQVARETGIESRTQVGDAMRKRIEPSKAMLRWMITKQGRSGHWVLTGDGPKVWEEIRTSVEDNKKLREENKSLILSLEKAHAKIETLQELLNKIYKGGRK